jgi:hypothetical protein
MNGVPNSDGERPIEGRSCMHCHAGSWTQPQAFEITQMVCVLLRHAHNVTR